MRPINKTYESKLFRTEIEQEHTMWFNWYYDYTDNYYSDQNDDYGYIDRKLEEQILNEVLLGTRFRKRKYAYLSYRVVDMESFYTKATLREKKINDLLGLPGGTGRTEKPTLGDLIKKDVG